MELPAFVAVGYYGGVGTQGRHLEEYRLLQFRILMVKIISMGANAKFGLMIIATLALLTILVISGERRDLKAGAGAKVDVKRIEQQVSEGKLTFHPAEFGKGLSSLEDAE